ncbi:hypothetical protein GCM10023144_17410 [Pigmentiphaga soli]|uniref:Uncharacterized protein n=1 Tax=Pigmentiphaga soli TaxID=1007095 RepID=A0ABP8GU79_9BURK
MMLLIEARVKSGLEYEPCLVSVKAGARAAHTAHRGQKKKSLNLLALLRQAQERKVRQQRKTDQMSEHLIRLSA